ncbi:MULTISPECIES: Uma2 family endonuclease [unclassified Saccharothrix]|uniref:Uma2 family endonuclease n=1 Tax=unclassified Saccharothrix TaxID=2593673 RepID=UPI00307FCF1A
MALPADYLLPQHGGDWTLDDVLALPEDSSQRVELVDGSLIVSPLGTRRHQRLIGGIYKALDGACPPGHEATIELNVGMPGGNLFIPDFTVTTSPEAEGLLCPAEDLLLVGEVLSPSTRFKDYGIKRQRYAAAGVPFYLLVEPTGPVATMFELENGEYVETARSEAGVLKLERPFPVTIELSP